MLSKSLYYNILHKVILKKVKQYCCGIFSSLRLTRGRGNGEPSRCIGSSVYKRILIDPNGNPVKLSTSFESVHFIRSKEKPTCELYFLWLTYEIWCWHIDICYPLLFSCSCFRITFSRIHNIMTMCYSSLIKGRNICGSLEPISSTLVNAVMAVKSTLRVYNVRIKLPC